MTDHQRSDDLLALGERLVALLKKENAALARNAAGEVRVLIDEKSALGRAFESRYKALADKPGQLAELPISQRQRLKDLCRRLDGLCLDNARLLKVALVAHEKVIAAVAEAVRTSQAGPDTYVPRHLPRRARTGNRRATPLSLDQAL